MPRGSIARAVGTEHAHEGIIDMPYLWHGKAKWGSPYRHFVPNGTSLNGCSAWGLQVSYWRMDLTSDSHESSRILALAKARIRDDSCFIKAAGRQFYKPLRHALKPAACLQPTFVVFVLLTKTYHHENGCIECFFPCINGCGRRRPNFHHRHLGVSAG